MILSISSSLATFKRVEFHEGLNVLLSDRQPGASEKQTRNSAGKTSLIDIIHFLLGSDCDKTSIFRTDELIDHTFTAEFSFWGQDLTIIRGGETPSRIYLLRGFEGFDDLPIKHEKKTERDYLSNDNWKVLLGHLLFHLPLDSSGTIFEKSYTPTFRSMLSYFIRRENSGGFISPERQAEKQQRWDWQENLSYLLDLDWRIPFEFQKVRSREKALEELKKAAKGGALGEVVGTVAELRSKVSVAEKKAAERKGQVDNFLVLDSYSDLAGQAAKAKTAMQLLSRETVGLRETLNHLEESFSAETPQDSTVLKKIYSSAGVELPGVALKRLDEVRGFYDSVITNRKSHLEAEILQITEKIAANTKQAYLLDKQRQEILKTLESRGALEDFLALQKELAELEAESASLKERFKSAELLEGEKVQLDIDRGRLLKRLQNDYQERKEQLDLAIQYVTEIITSLYDDRDGGFEISATPGGPEFKISIEGDRGGGISKMEIFCLDLALLKINVSKNRGPGILIHDSHLFDGVDERQIASALFLAATAVKGGGIQYLVTMNTDIFDRLELSKEIDRKDVTLKTRLSDKTLDGGLFGFRFS